jgi:Cellulase (glycosyl hydrolase family 5)
VPLTEPHGETADEIAGNHALPKQVWNTLYPRLINAIRAEAPERWIIVMPIWGSVDNLVDLSVSAAPNLIYSFHFYDPHFFTHQGLQGAWPPAQSVVYPGLTRDESHEPEIFWDKSVIEQALLPAVNFRTLQCTGTGPGLFFALLMEGWRSGAGEDWRRISQCLRTMTEMERPT